MSNMAEQLNQRCQLWGQFPFENELGETDVKDGIIKELVYCNIMPKSAMRNSTPVTESETFTHKFKVRAKSLEPKLDMYFMFKGKKHEFKSWNPDYKNNEFLEIFTECKLE